MAYEDRHCGRDRNNLMEYVLAPEVFDRLQQAMASNLEGLADLYRDYLADARRALTAMHEALLQNSHEQLRSHAHYLKGSSQILGAPAVAKHCAAIEEKACATDLGGVELLLRSTETALDETERELAKRLGAAAIPEASRTAQRDQID